MRVRQIRDATPVIDYAGVRFLIDPWFQAKGTDMLAPSPWTERNVPSPPVDLPCSVEEVLADVDAVVVTHVHPDHFEQHTAGMLNRTLPLYVQNVMDEEDVWKLCQAAPWTKVVASHRESKPVAVSFPV